MPDLLKGNRDTLPDHLSPDGDKVAWSFLVRAIGLDDLIVRELKVNIHASNALSVAGHIKDEAYALSLLDHAIEALGGYHQQVGGLVIPGKDTSLPEQVKKITVSGPVEDKLYAVACMQQAKAAIIDMHARRRFVGTRKVVEL